MTYHLAIDIGASSGRHILGYIADGKLQFEEIYRFDNGIVRDGQSLVWDIGHLTDEVKKGIRKCFELGKLPSTVAIDTWGVDYVLLDKDKKELLPVHCYRDGRTDSIIGEVESLISREELYSKTGIQKIYYNTVYQLYCDKVSGKLEKAEYFMMMPSYLSYRLTGVIKNEYTDASTTAMVNVGTKQWDRSVISALGYPQKLFGELSVPGRLIGRFSDEMKEYAGFDADVIFCPSHDTASAVAGCPMGKSDVFISSGTWSLIGTELTGPVNGQAALDANFANEGGMEYRFRFLKNYMGMWLMQGIRKSISKSLTYDEMMYAAMDCGKYTYLDVNDQSLIAPDDMVKAIRDYFESPDMPLGEVINSVYHSLARSYKYAVGEIEKITGMTVTAIHIVGGGCQDKYLNRLTSEYTGKPVTAGPIEATAAGNIVSQLIYGGECTDLESARELISRSFSID